MTELENAIVATLRAEAEEAAMTTDTARESEKLDRRLDGLDRRRRRHTWIGVAVAAAVVVLAFVAVRALGTRGTADVVAPVPQAVVVTTTTLTPNFTAALPAWTSAASYLESDQGLQGWNQIDCSEQPEKKCPAGQDLRLRFFSVAAMFRPADGPTVTSRPTYAQYVAHIKALPAAGVATVEAAAPLKVGGRPATAFSVTPTVEAPGAIACATEFEAKRDCWGGFAVGRQLRLVVVDQGAGVEPTVMMLGMNFDNPDQAKRTAEFDTMLTTVSFD